MLPDKYFKRKSIEDEESIKVSSYQVQRKVIEINPDTLLVDPGLRRPIYEYHINNRDAIRRAYLQKGPCQPSHYDFPYMFELISNAYLYNIIFVNNLPPHLKNSGSATGQLCPCLYLGHFLNVHGITNQIITGSRISKNQEYEVL
jgi:hypothetical protein